jgi:L-Lysine epsilon oxidase N-terminal/L-lysine epsilon oxidase C-terminal domain
MPNHQPSSAGDGAPGGTQPDCGADPFEALRQMFVDMVMGSRIGGGQDPALRPVFLKPHGVAGGTFTVRPDLPDDLRVGVFAGKRYPAWVRFSSDTQPTTPDLKTTCGIGIKLFDVPGKKILPPNTDATTHDFVLQNHDVFFVDTASDMCEFTHAGVVLKDYGQYLAAHPKTSRILDEMEKQVPSVLESEYWSGLPSKFGDDRHVKYKLAPAGILAGAAAGLSTDDPDYLHLDLRRRLLDGEAVFHFFVQFQTDPERMPLDAATVRWEESASPPVHVATLTLPRQDVDASGQPEYGENLAFNSWHALAEHEPVGSVAEARKVVYQAAADLRRRHNKVRLAEPKRPRRVEVDPAGRDRRVVRAAIHPAIGVARVGDSEDEFLVGPEVDQPAPLEAGSAKDRHGALKRQAARFRVYGYNAAGEAVAELTADNAEIEWAVHVANEKAAWYQFQIALDIPEARAKDAPPAQLRNQAVTGAEREKLSIDPGPRTIAGRDRSGPGYRFASGTFMDKEVYLGELRTDGAGRLLFLGGRGVSASSDGSPPDEFANNDKWHDDVSDGPVTAEVTIDGESIPVDPAWVTVAPPNYAPDLTTVRTMYDLLHDEFVQAGWLPFPEQVSFMEHIYPLLRRLAGLQWVNHGFATKFGWGGPEDFLDPAYLTRLASPLEEHKELRQQIWNAFRDWDRDGKSPTPWPWIYGDSMNIPPVSERQHTMLSPTQMRLLERWKDGDFEPDLDLDTEPPGAIEDVPVPDQPRTLDRAALSFCLADAFHPGCEMTWPVRHTSMYMAPFRLRHRAIGDPEPSLGSVLTPDAVLSVDGPLYGQHPGSLTRWMAVPWQTDTASCRSGYPMGYELRYDPYVPTFWAARVPNHVLTERDYEIVIDEARPIGERQAAFERRAVWLRWLDPHYMKAIAQMVTEFGKLGVVEERPGPADGAFPASILVESEVSYEHRVHPLRNLHTIHVPEARDPAVADEAIASAIEASGHPAEEVSAGYLPKVDRFGRGRQQTG